MNWIFTCTEYPQKTTSFFYQKKTALGPIINPTLLLNRSADYWWLKALAFP